MKTLIFTLLALVASVLPAQDVKVSSPLNNSLVQSKFSLVASTSSCAGQPVSAMGFSFDNSSNTTIVYSSYINQTIAAPSLGAHILHVKAWGKKGSSCVTSVNITVQDVVKGDVTIFNLVDGNMVVSPFMLDASSPTCNGQPTLSMGFSFDGSSNTTFVSGANINQNINVPGVGPHVLHVKSWGQGTACVADVNLIGSNGPSVPATAVQYPNIQMMQWSNENDTATSGGSSGSSSLAASSLYPAPDQKRIFNYSFSNYGGERFHASMANLPGSLNFVYDTWVYIVSGSQIANIEMDLNQVLPNGDVIIYGFQCDGWKHVWDYTENAGTVGSPVDTWIHSSIPCNLNQTQNSWHHVQIEYSRDYNGNVTYKNIWLDNIGSSINATVPSQFALGWGQVLLTNFQLDGSAISGSGSVYIDKTTISGW